MRKQTTIATGDLIKITSDVDDCAGMINWYGTCKGKIGVVIKQCEKGWLEVFCDGGVRILYPTECLKLKTRR